MLAFLLWYLATSLIGLLAFPLAFRLLPALPDRGWAFARLLGLLLWGYGFWLAGSLGLLGNNLGGQLVALLALALLSGWALRGISFDALRAWWREKRSTVLAMEIVFLAAFAAWAFVRAANPDINGTEKPMELAFINSILRSPGFPPNDPWLSGYAISYYYFGYVLTAMLARLSGVPGNIAFNLMISLVFGLSALGAYGLVYNLLNLRRKPKTEAVLASEAEIASEGEPPGKASLGLPLLGPLFILLVSNFEGFLELLHARGLFWQDGTSRFWSWLGIADLNQPPLSPPAWVPRLFGTGSWWWWRASRVVLDFDLAGNSKGDIIDEFPFFSYMLADLHPHVLAMPFMFLVMALALNLFLGGAKGTLDLRLVKLRISPPYFLALALVLGGMAFLNTWDILAATALFAAAYAFQRSGEDEAAPQTTHFELWPLIAFILTLGISAVLLYLPFYVGFSSQAGGILPNLVFVTHGTYFWVHFGPLLLPIFAYLIYLWVRWGDFPRFLRGLLISLGFVLGLYIICLVLAAFIANLPRLQGLNPQAADAPGLFLSVIGAQSWAQAMDASLARRLQSPGTWLTLILLLGAVIGLFFAFRKRAGSEGLIEPAASVIKNPSHRFALILILVGALLTIGPEFFWLRDIFGTRINTIFKFYFQTWLVWGIAAAFGTAVLLQRLRGLPGILFKVGLVTVLAMGLTYTAYGLWDKTSGFTPAGGLTLDGTRYLEQYSPDELAAARWLQSAPLGVEMEATGGQYSDYGRIATLTGLPTVLGWDGHELQWRGSRKEIGSRPDDIARFYSTRSSDEAEQILQKYQVRYVILGPRERNSYGASETRLDRFLHRVFEQGTYIIYETTTSSGQ